VDDSINAFLAEARRYCLLVEDSAPLSSWMFAWECLSQVLRLYEMALHLPEVEPERGDLLPSISHETWQALRDHVGRKLSRDYYWDIFEPLEKEKPEPVVGSISDDLADIWRDVKPGIAEIDAGRATSPNEAVWHWRSSFETHWGRHAAGAVVALHSLCFGQFADASRPPAASTGR